jgi:hypothetical protein
VAGRRSRQRPGVDAALSNLFDQFADDMILLQAATNRALFDGGGEEGVPKNPSWDLTEEEKACFWLRRPIDKIRIQKYIQD